MFVTVYLPFTMASVDVMRAMEDKVVLKGRDGPSSIKQRVFEPLLDVETTRYTLFPIQDNEIFQFYKKAVASFWVVEEVDLTQDIKDYEKLSGAEQHFLCSILAFFASSDGIVGENLISNFACEVKLQEARLFYAFQEAIEGIHSEMYSLLIDTLIKDPTEKDRLFNAVTTVPVVNKKANWAAQWFDAKHNTFQERLVAFACTEGILFCSSFAAIFFFNKKGVMPGLSLSNQFIARDESMHTEFAVLLHSKLQNKASEKTIKRIVGSAVEVEVAFVEEALRTPILGMNADSMSQYVKFVADRLLVSLDCSKLYNATNPFPWMDTQSLLGTTNFFEQKPSSYNKAGVGVLKEEMAFSINADF
jgi:ribonucleotide reductase beta subunit family protein with ferritin-like domain